MKTTEKIAEAIKGMQEGEVFTYDNLGVKTAEYPAAAKALGRLVAAGAIKRATTGMFYKPKTSVFGELKPGEDELLRTYLYDKKGKRQAYVTGISLYNKMGLTTQVPRTIRLASRSKRIFANLGTLKIQPVKSYAEVTNENYPLLEILDAIKDLKIIPDTNKANALQILKSRITTLTNDTREKLVTLAMVYPPRTRAMLGAILEEMKAAKRLLNKLQKSLNPLSAYQYGIGKDILYTFPNWNIS